ncbi:MULTISPECIES: hypothetical protein [unclassified Gilliamella]|uniref:hypothetical protein n=1 Tax=unclassified Gilliamella TaxID=2685620 RepID=UPI0013070022|nr:MULTISPECIES: hypothetical protein [unclassified Gilliamella]MWP49895.1 hypothetical protein [Gilliamella sp. Lep-s35]MWP68531.1 hypothetical protein [Gilliamella sp. Lep-s5]MWP77934.1 hypothetical protein [Gilliamella sp. Lep-s21]
MIRFIIRQQNKLMALLLLTIALVAIRLYPHAPLSEPLTFSTRYYDNNNQLIRMTLTDVKLLSNLIFVTINYY